MRPVASRIGEIVTEIYVPTPKAGSKGFYHKVRERLAWDHAIVAVATIVESSDNVVRNGREWVPAVIRYNLIPTRLLLEICNLGNDKDRALMKTKKYRQRVAEAIYQGLVNYYNDREDDRPAPAIASGR